MIQRFTLIHPIEGSYVISELSGWEQAIFTFERDPRFHSLVETYKAPLTAYGTNGSEDGGRDYLLRIESIYGPDAEIQLKIEESESDQVEDFVQIVLMSLPVIEFKLSLDKGFTLDFQTEPVGIWNKVISRQGTPVDIRSTTNLDNTAVVPVPSVDVKLTSQKVRQLAKFNQLVGYDFGTEYDAGKKGDVTDFTEIAKDKYFSIDLEDSEISEIPTKLSLGNIEYDDIPTPIFIVDYAGEYTINVQLCFGIKQYFNLGQGFDDGIHNDNQGPIGILTAASDGVRAPTIKIYIQINEDPPIEFNAVNTGLTTYPGSPSTIYSHYTTFSYNEVRLLKAKDNIRLYGKVLSNNFGYSYIDTLTVTGHDILGHPTYGGVKLIRVAQLMLLGKDNSKIKWPESVYIAPYAAPAFPVNNLDSFLSISANTVFPETICPSFFQHDVFGGIIDRITGLPTAFHSPYLGSQYTQYKTYASEGRNWKYINARGLQIRNYTLLEKPFAQSLSDQWDGADPVFNLSLRYDKLNGNDVIIIDKKEACYDDSSCSIYLTNVLKISRVYDQDFFFNQVETGYNNWESEDVSGIDDPQTKRTWASRFKTVGKKLSLLSNFIAASLVWETTRRTTRLKSTDYKFDNDTFLLSIVKTGTGYEPELDEEFTSVTNLLNEETRYNKRLSSARNFLRWFNFVCGGLQSYVGSFFKFVSGEGNFDMVSRMNMNGERETFNGQPLSEKQDLQVGTDYLFLPILYTINHYLTIEQYKAVQANRNLAIGISQTDDNFTNFFIKSLQYTRATGEVTIEAWPTTFLEIKVPDNPDNEQEGSNDYVFDSSFTHPPFN
jgi:hypothetical protein